MSDLDWSPESVEAAIKERDYYKSERNKALEVVNEAQKPFHKLLEEFNKLMKQRNDLIKEKILQEANCRAFCLSQTTSATELTKYVADEISRMDVLVFS